MEDEHKLFLEALQQHGRAWRRIQGQCLCAYHLRYGHVLALLAQELQNFADIWYNLQST